MKYFENKYTRFQERKKNIIQALATLATNANLKGFFEGKIYTGNTKVACVPGLNCYSCPGAVGSCPIGSLQAVIGSKKFSISYYVFGIMILIGALLGRLVCGLLCPFGFVQDLLYKIQSFKIHNITGICNTFADVFDKSIWTWSTLFLQADLPGRNIGRCTSFTCNK